MFVVMGATGHTGSVVAQSLIDRKQAVRVIVRSAAKGEDWKAKGAEVAVADLMDVDAMTAALHGAHGAYFLLPPDVQNPAFLNDSGKRADAIVAAARSARLSHAVILSSVGAQFDDRVGPISTIARLERSIVAAGIPLTAVRPGYFLENICDVLPAAQHQGVYPSMILPLDLKIDMVATRDIGAVIAEALLDPAEQPLRIIELRGADRYSAEDIAAALSKRLGRAVMPVAVPPADWVPQLQAAGVSRQAAESLAEMHENINSGRITFLDPNARKGRIDLDAFLGEIVV